MVVIGNHKVCGVGMGGGGGGVSVSVKQTNLFSERPLIVRTFIYKYTLRFTVIC